MCLLRVGTQVIRCIVLTAILVTVLAGSVGIIMLAKHWPFRRDRVLESLARATQCEVSTLEFTPLYFPKPGGRLREVVFRRGQAPPLATIREVTLQSSW